MKQYAKKLTNFVNISKLLISLGFVVFFLINIFGLSLSVSKQFHLNILQCASSQQQNGCNNVSQHVSNWQSVFAAVESEAVFSFLLVIFGLALYALNRKTFSFSWSNIDGIDIGTRSLRKRFPNFLQIALSTGILQPTR